MNERGQALVEFAFILPIMLFMFLGMVELGFYFLQANHAQTTASAAAQAGAGELPDITEAEAVALEVADMNGAGSNQVEVTAETETVTVTVRKEVLQFFFNLEVEQEAIYKAIID